MTRRIDTPSVQRQRRFSSNIYIISPYLSQEIRGASIRHAASAGQLRGVLPDGRDSRDGRGADEEARPPAHGASRPREQVMEVISCTFNVNFCGHQQPVAISKKPDKILMNEGNQLPLC